MQKFVFFKKSLNLMHEPTRLFMKKHEVAEIYTTFPFFFMLRNCCSVAQPAF